MKSITNQTNSLVKVGDTIVIKTPLPINPDEITILGYDVITQDIMDFQDWVGGHYAISPISTDASISQNELNWKILWKDVDGTSKNFVKDCGEQTEPYYLYFRFEKLESKTDQIINISKVNLKIQDSDKLKELREKFPFYYQSIFNEDSPNDTEVLIWQYNVLEKISGDSILPHYIEKDRDFSIFWGWICHFFAIIVHFGRKFKCIFDDILSNLDIIGEFLKQKGYYKDSRVRINQDLKIALSEELIYSPIINTRLDENGYPVYMYRYIFSGYLPIKCSGIIILKVGGYNKSVEFKTGINVGISLAYYSKEYTCISRTTYNLNQKTSLEGIRILIPENKENNEIAYVGISYPRIGNSNLPLYIRVFVEGNGNYFLEQKEKEQIFKIQKDFRKRGTQSVNNLIKKILEAKKDDGFYSGYLDKEESGWFLNKTCPINKELKSKIKIDTLVPKFTKSFANGLFIEYLDQFLVLNQNTSLDFKWLAADTVNKLFVFASLYDENGKELYDVILGNWQKHYDESSDLSLLKNEINIKQLPTTSEFYPKGICLYPILKNGYYESHMPINIVKSIASGSSFGKDFNYGQDLINQNLYLISKTNSLNEDCQYLKIKGIFLSKTDISNDSHVIAHSIVSGYSSVNLIITSSSISLQLDGTICGNVNRSELDSKGINLIKFMNENSDLGSVILFGIPNNGSIKLNITGETPNMLNNKVDLESILSLRKLPISFGFLNNAQYHICCFKNNGSYSDEEAKEIIAQKILPYNGMKIFINNSDYKDNISIPLQLDKIYFEKINKSSPSDSRNLIVTIKGGIGPYTFKLNDDIVIANYQEFKKEELLFGNYFLTIVDSLGSKINTQISCTPYNDIDYKLRVYIDINSNVDLFIYVYGGTETSYTVTLNGVSRVIAAKVWTKLNFYLYSSQNIIQIEDSVGNFILQEDMSALFKNLALDIYDNGEGENYN